MWEKDSNMRTYFLDLFNESEGKRISDLDIVK